MWIENSSPLFTAGSSSGDRAYYPSVIKVGSTYHLWYGDADNVRHATSTNIDFNDFSFHASVVSGLSSGDYHPHVLYNAGGLTIGGDNYDGPFFMYSARGDGTGEPKILHSTDGDNWISIGSVIGANSAFDTSNLYNFVVINVDEETWKAYGENGGGRVGYFTSIDGLNWILVNGDILGDEIQSWETTNNTRPFVMKVGDYYVMFYGNGASNNKAIGMAVSTDGENFVKSDANPIFSIDDDVEWRDSRTYTPTVIKDDVGYTMYFAGKDADTPNNFSLGYATNTGLFWLIQDAINAANFGSTVNVAAGTYAVSSTIVIDKEVTLQGPQSGVDPRPSASTTRVAGDSTEAIVDGDGVLNEIFQIDADNVEINGFEIKSGTGDLIKSEGDVIYSPIIRYNIIHDSSGDEGIQLKKTEDAIIEFNNVFDTDGDGINLAFSHNGIIQSNEVHQIRSGNAAIYVYNDAADTPAFADFMNIIIQNNLVYNIIQNDGIKVGDSSSGQLDELLQSNAKVLNNIIHDVRQDGITIQTSKVLVEGNTITRSASVNGAIYVDDQPDDITITNNIIRDNGEATIDDSPINDAGTTYGIRVGKDSNQPTNVIINNNKIQGNEAGLFFNFQSGDDLDASGNWWGTNTAAGVAAEVTSNVDYSPWLDSGTDIDAGTAGFQGDFSVLNVDDDSPQTGSTGRIQEGINLVSGSTVNVAAGTYAVSSTIVIDKTVTLQGPQSGVDPRPSAGTTRVAGDSAEAIVDGGGTLSKIFQINANDVVIDGFEIKSGTGDLIKASEGAIKLRPIVKYNIIHDSSGDEGVQLKSVDDAVIEFNHVYDTGGDGINIALSHDSKIQFNEVHDIRSPDAAIYVYNDGQREFINILIQNNLVYDVHNNDGIKLGAKGGTDSSLVGGSILNNVVHDTRQDGITIYASDVLVDGNEVYNSASENGAIYVSWTPDNITISNNNIHDNGESSDTGSTFDDPATTYGVRIGKSTFPTNVVVNENTIRDNEAGLFYNFQTNDPALDATKNYWGNVKGPTHDSNPKGKGDIVTDNVNFDPWYLNSALTNLSSDQIGNKLKSQNKNVKLDSSNNGDVTGQASLPTDVEELELNNDAVLDLATNIVTATDNPDGDITIGGQAKKLKTFTSGTLVNVDLTVEKTVGDKKVIVKKAVKMRSGTENKPIIITNVELPSVSVSIPDGTTILAPDGWNGTIQPPKTASGSGAAPSAFTVGNVVIEVGSPDVVLLFDTPVDILLFGVTGNVGYKPAGSSTWIQITNSCGGTFDSPDDPVFPGECFISNGVDTKIFTYHFTTFGSLNVKSGSGCFDCIKPVLQSNSLSSSDSNIFGGTLKLDDSAKNSASLFETGDVIDLELSFYEDRGRESLEHVTLFTNIRGYDDRYDSNLYVEWNKGKPLKVYDPEGYLDDTTNVSFAEHSTDVVMTFHLNFVKPMNVSHIVLYYWDFFKNSGQVTFEDALKIFSPVNTIIPELQTDDATTNNDMINGLIGTPQKEELPELQTDDATTNNDMVNGLIDTPQKEEFPEYVTVWIKDNAGQWADGQIKDSTFTNVFQYWIQEKIVDGQISPNVSADPDDEIIEEQYSEIPKWVKNSAKWWSEDMISENEFVNSIQWLVANGVIVT